MYKIQAPQVKAARALLGWSQEDLAEAAKLSITTIRTMELGYAPRSSTLLHICKTIESNGLEFTDGEGVRRRDDEVKVLKGSDSCDKLFADIQKTIKEQNSDVLVAIKSLDILTQTSGVDQRNNLDRLKQVQEIAGVKCLLAEDFNMLSVAAPLQLRAISQAAIGPSSCFVYGDKYVHILPEGRLNFLIVIFNIASVANDHRKHFLSVWERAWPVQLQAKKKPGTRD